VTRPDPAIRDARPAERAALEDLQRRASLMWEEYRDFLLANPEAVELPLSQILENRVRVAERGSQALGFCVLLPRGDICELDGLFVEPDHWRQGIARLLMADAAARARACGVRAIEVVANPRAEGFYRKLGFAVSGRAQTLFGPANRMRMLVFPA
jgi:GNAT superfamily N-acetyltransferase